MNSPNVKGHTPSQEKIARLLSGIEGAPRIEALRMVSKASKVGAKLDQRIAELEAENARLNTVLENIMKHFDEKKKRVERYLFNDD